MTPMLPLDLRLAQVCHEAYRAWCETQGDHSQPVFTAAGEDVIDGALSLVKAVREGQLSAGGDHMRMRIYAALIGELDRG